MASMHPLSHTHTSHALVLALAGICALSMGQRGKLLNRVSWRGIQIMVRVSLASMYPLSHTHTHTNTHTRTSVLCWLVFAHSQWGSAESIESSFLAWYLEYGSIFACVYASPVTHTHIHALWYYAGWYLRTLNGATRKVLDRVSWRGI